MVEALFVAAGGGGDVIAAALIARALGLNDRQTMIATLAWERLLIDPAPGPRTPADFVGLSLLGQHNIEILPSTQPKAPGTSSLPRLRADLAQRLALLDPRQGALGLAEQLGDLTSLLTGSRRVFLIDVGGDVLADGPEPGLKSPLADALMLAAVAHLNTSVDLLVAGPGLDGELSQRDVLERLRALGATRRLTLQQEQVEPALGILEWHPSEATALFVATAMGLTGIAEIRDAGTQLALSRSGSEVWSVPASVAIAGALAEILVDTASFSEAEDALRRTIGWTELDYERAKAAATTPSRRLVEVDNGVMQAAHEFESEAAARGTNYVTFRRIAEAVGAPQAHVELRASLTRHSTDRNCPPLWRVS